MKSASKYVFAVLLCMIYMGTASSQEPSVSGDSIENRFLTQQYAFPQEKIYLHCDKSCYIAGEEIWFRVYLLDYASQLPDTTSRYVYVELVAPADTLVLRVKIRHENGVFKGYIPLPKKTAEGDYILRCYTRFMTGIGEEYFFRRRIQVVNAGNKKPFQPFSVFEKEFDVSFFPEGGHFPAGRKARVAFKALFANGMGAKVTGEIFSVSSPSEPLAAFASNELGMGSFFVEMNESDSCYAVCRNEAGDEKRFGLPRPNSSAVSLQCVWSGNLLTAAAISPANMTALPEGMRLIVHCRGTLIYSKEWDTKNIFVQFSKDMFPSGVIHFILTDKYLNPLSERLVFNLNSADLANVTFEADKPSYMPREQVRSGIKITDDRGLPLEGSFSISVTDDRDVDTDSTVNILSALLLTSELKGYIESPAWYLQNDRLPQLDNLMLTQGWSRYRIPEVIRGNIEPVRGTLEVGPEISGYMKSGVFLQNRGKGYSVMLVSHHPPVVRTAIADSNGFFRFSDVELPDSTLIQLKALSPKKSAFNCEMTVNEETYPAIRYRLPRTGVEKPVRETFLQKAEQKYISEQEERIIELSEVSVTAKRKKGISPISVGLGRIIPLEEIKKKENSARNMYVFLRSLAGLTVTPDLVSWSFEGVPPIIIIDKVQMEDGYEFLYGIRTELIEEIEFVKPGFESAFLHGYSNAYELGAIIITSKARDGGYPQRDKGSRRSIIPLGYQKSKEFYAPRYETDEQKKSPAPDLRTTIYWNPDIRTDSEGKAELDFYAADAVTTYSVIIEGVADGGQLIRKEEKIRLRR